MAAPYLRFSALLCAATLTACGGLADVELAVDTPTRYASTTMVVLTDESFVPDGASCPSPGRLHPHRRERAGV
ncbi:MAG: hypothetical protein KA375_09110 [Vitreoscilla sp.]|nr:hypothetical protein [Burkholderiales bacterium]MBP6337742.1 hypothetical protein [Vitreoscilla sp.]MBP6675664.1 hypothetical protein [Vitreoscilla sp.]